MGSRIDWNDKGQGHDGDKTTTGATCQGNYQSFIEEGKMVLRVGDKTTVCPACKQIGVIDTGDESVILDGVPVAVDGSVVRCGCPYGTNRVVAPLVPGASTPVEKLGYHQSNATKPVQEYRHHIEDNCLQLFKRISSVILRHEGGYVNDPDDKGGETNMRITIDTWKAYAKADLGLEATSETLKSMTKMQAETIYYKHYWKPKGFCKFENTKIALMIYDWTITSGKAIKQIRKMLHSEYNPKIVITNTMDSDMINCINNIDEQDKLLLHIAEVRKSYYHTLIMTDGKPNSQAKYLKGWLNRVDDCLKVNI